jgi:uncharacterized protein (TIGR03437 family)
MFLAGAAGTDKKQFPYFEFFRRERNWRLASQKRAPGEKVPKGCNSEINKVATCDKLFSGLAPGFAGLYQVNAIVPSGVTAGSSVPVVVTAAGASSAPVTVVIK